VGEELRKIADQLIQASTVDGQLDLKRLQRLSNDHIDKAVLNDPNFATITRVKEVRIRKNELMDHLTVATREVLGIIPKEQWNQDNGNVLASMFKQVFGAAEQPPQHGLVCQAPEGVSLGNISPHESLGGKGVKCIKSDKIARQ